MKSMKLGLLFAAALMMQPVVAGTKLETAKKVTKKTAKVVFHTVEIGAGMALLWWVGSNKWISGKHELPGNIDSTIEYPECVQTWVKRIYGHHGRDDVTEVTPVIVPIIAGLLPIYDGIMGLNRELGISAGVRKLAEHIKNRKNKQ